MIYGRRQGRALKSSTRRVLDDILPKFQIKIENGSINWMASLEEYQDVWMEIGFGSGDHLAFLAERYPHTLMIGCEPFITGVGSLLKTIERKNLTNIRLFTGAAQNLLSVIPRDICSKIFLLFPDPWPKKRHHKRRFIQLHTMPLLSAALKIGGHLLFATDHLEYRVWALDVFKTSKQFIVEYRGPQNPPDWTVTRFQQKGMNEGRHPYFILLKNNGISVDF